MQYNTAVKDDEITNFGNVFCGNHNNSSEHLSGAQREYICVTCGDGMVKQVRKQANEVFKRAREEEKTHIFYIERISPKLIDIDLQLKRWNSV